MVDNYSICKKLLAVYVVVFFQLFEDIDFSGLYEIFTIPKAFAHAGPGPNDTTGGNCWPEGISLALWNSTFNEYPQQCDRPFTMTII